MRSDEETLAALRRGDERVFVELTDHGFPGDSTRNDLLAGMAAAVAASLPDIKRYLKLRSM